MSLWPSCSVLDPGDLVDAVRAEDRSAFARASGVGAHLARRIVTELKDKVEDMGPVVAAGPDSGAGSVEEDAIAAPGESGIHAVGSLACGLIRAGRDGG